MASVSKSVLVEHGAQQMFDLVERVEDYPAFLPWCGGTTILERTPTASLVRIDINYHGVRAHFTTANRNERPELIVIELRDGPFRQLDGTWHFQPLAPAARSEMRSTRPPTKARSPTSANDQASRPGCRR